MKNIKKSIVSLIGLSFSCLTLTSIASPEKSITVVNSSPDGYMEISYMWCNNSKEKPACSLRTPKLILYSKKYATKERQNYIDLEIPDDAQLFKGMHIHEVVEKAVVNGQPTDTVISKTFSRFHVCEGHLPTTTKNDTDNGPHVVLELSEMDGLSSRIVCTNKQS